MQLKEYSRHKPISQINLISKNAGRKYNMGNLVLNKMGDAVQSGGTVYPLTAALALNASRNSVQRCAWNSVRNFLSVDMGDYYMLTGYRLTCIT